jgi:hypothetical protein
MFSIRAKVASSSIALVFLAYQGQAQQTLTVGPDERLPPACFCLSENRSSATVVECTTSICRDGSRPIALQNGADIRGYLRPQPDSANPGQAMSGQSLTQQRNTPLALGAGDPQHYQAMQLRFGMAPQFCRAGDQYACDDVSHQGEWSQNAEQLFQLCQTGDQASCQLYKQFRRQTFEIADKLQQFLVMPQAPATMPSPVPGIQQGRPAIPPAGTQSAMSPIRPGPEAEEQSPRQSECRVDAEHSIEEFQHCMQGMGFQIDNGPRLSAPRQQPPVPGYLPRQ